MKVDARFLNTDGREIFTGNELLLKGALETEGGMHLLGGYPGSPIAGFFDALGQINELLNAKGIRAVINNNEALAAAMLNGSQVVGCRGMIVIKSVGVHVAADALALGNLAGANPDGGAVVVYGDDPWSDSTQVAADSRYISKHLFIPTIEPACPQEIKDFVDLSVKLSRRSELYAGYVLTNNLADGGGTVQCGPNHFPDLNTGRPLTLDTGGIDLDKYVLLPPKTWWQEANLADRFARAVRAARELGLNRVEHPQRTRRPIGFVTSGLAHGYLVQALLELGVLGDTPIAKFGMSYPIDEGVIAELAGQCERIVVVEERRGFMEEQIGEVLLRARQAGGPAGDVELWGKRFPFDLPGLPEIRGLDPSIIIERLVGLLGRVADAGASPATRRTWDRAMETIERTAQVDVGALPTRLPTFCPGCPHRDSSSLCLEIKKKFMDAEYMRRVHGRGPVDLLFHGDTGCYTMMMFPPTTDLMHDYSGMGLGAGTGSGTDPFITNKQVVFLGDSTFFHSGQIGISQAIKLGQDITFIILDNRTTAMTGHQPTPGVDYDILGNPTAAQSIDEIIRGMGAEEEVSVVRCDVERRTEYGRLLEKTFLADGVKVVIADKECGITRMRRKRREERAVVRARGYLPVWEHMNINPEICRFCLSCAEQTGCPGLKHVDTDYGPKMDTDITWCVDDGACERVGACSAFERVTIRRKMPPRSRVPELGLDHIPEPEKRPHGDLWRCCLAGVGGMGIGVATSILVRAAHKEGYEVGFLDKKGLAIRNGGVVSQVVYNIAGMPVTPIMSHGQADLLLGVDVLEAARALAPTSRSRVASPDRTAAVINTHKVNTSMALMGWEDFDPDDLARIIRENTNGDDFLARDISRICEKYLGNKVYANIMMLGFAFQKGLIPVSMHSMAWAIKDTIRADHRKNLYAFNMGRKLVLRDDLFLGPPERTDWRDVLDEKCRCVIRRHGRVGQGLADGLRQLAAETVNKVAEVDADLKRAIVVRLYDCTRWGGLDYAREYADAVTGVCARDGAAHGFAATRAVVYNLADAMLIKDAVYLAELSTSPEKYARDRRKYNVNPANGDHISYRHFWHLPVCVAGREFRLNVTVYDWMLKVLRTMRVLRKLPGWQAERRRRLEQYLRRVRAFAPSSADDYRRQLVAISSSACMDCMNPRCSEAGCPLASRVPVWMRLAHQQQWREAAETLLEDNNFPEITARVCPAQCEQSCKRGLGGYAVQIRDMERQIIDHAFDHGWVVPVLAPAKTGRRVAVVGSGPAGLAAAQQLVRAGHDVTVFEADDRVGGLLRHGIPAHRLPKELIDRRVTQMETEGVTFRTGARVGPDVSAAKLRKDFDAVLIATGARRARDLDLPGRQLKGIHLAMDFLRHGDGGGEAAVSAEGKAVAVIGGGLTGQDCVELAVAQGAAEVHQLEILAEADGAAGMADDAPASVTRHWCVATRAFSGSASNVAGLRAVQVKWTLSDDGRVPEELAGTQFDLDVDMVVLAVGFDAAIDPELAAQLGLATTDDGRLVVKDLAGSADGVFAAGDLVTGPAYVATAIDTGRRAAEKIDAYLARLPKRTVEPLAAAK